MSVDCMKDYVANCCVKGKNEETGEEEKYSFYEGAKAMMMTGPLNLLLPCTIIAFISDGLGWNSGITFAFALVAIAPFAERLGFVTEQLALHTNETIGGLLNATFGNATELIVAIAALALGKYRLVQLSLLGSILSNVLLVLGSAFWLGGYYHKTLTFGKSTAQINCVLLMLGVMGILFPTVLTWTNAETAVNEVGFSRATAILNFFGYVLFLYFQIVTHPDAYDEPSDGEENKGEEKNDEEERLLDNNIRQKSDNDAGISLTGVKKVSPTNGTVASSTPRTQPDSQVNDITGRGSFASDGGRGSFATDAGGGGNVIAAKAALSALMDDDDKTTPRSNDGLISEIKNKSTLEQQQQQGKSSNGDVEEGGLIRSIDKTVNNEPTANTAKTAMSGAVSDKIEEGDAKHEGEEEEEEEEDILGFWYAIVWLAIITVFISFLSDALVISIDIASVDWHVSGIFLSTIVIPIIGNAAEHASSIVAACKNKCDLSLGIAVGSSTQISLCVLPLLVIIGWGMDRPMSMNFEPYEAFTLVTTVMILGFAITHGTATWITGAALFIAYLIVAAGFFCHYDEPLEDHAGRR